MQRKGFRDPDPGEDPLVGMTAAGPAGTPAVPRGAAGPPRPGWPAMYLWLVSALVGWGPPIEAITRISVTWQRIRPTRGVVPKTLPITAVLAGLAVKAAGHAEKVLVNRWQALRRASKVLTRWLVPSTIAALPRGSGDTANGGGADPDRHDFRHRSGRTESNDRGTRTWPPGNGVTAHSLENRRPGQENRETKINNTT